MASSNGDGTTRSGRGRRHAAAFGVCLVWLSVLTGCGASGTGSEGGAKATTTTPRKAGTPTTTTVAPATTTSAAPTTTTTTPPPPDIRSVDLQAGSYRALCPTDPGEVEIGVGRPTATPGGPVTVDVFEPAYGDVTGDGRDDAVIQITCVFADGGNASVASVALVTSEAGGPRQLGAPVEGFTPVIHGSSVVVSRAIFQDSDARCCPSTLRYQPLTFQTDHLAEGGGGTPVGSGTEATTAGLGGFAAGRTYAEVAAATGQAIEVGGDPDVVGDCRYVTIVGGPEDVDGLGDPDRLRSIQVGNPAVRTSSGLGLDSTEAEVYAAFPGRVAARDHEYITGGHYLDFTPVDTPEQVAIFDTDGSSVVYFRVGEAGWAGAIEGCL